MKTVFRARTRSCFKQSLSLCLAITAMIAATEFPVRSAQAQARTSSQPAGIRDIPDANSLPPAPGPIFDMAGQRYIMFDDLVSHLAGTRFILIGEKHDNPIHHHHQAQLVRALSKREGTKCAVVWEMFDRDQQESLDQDWQAVPPEELGSEMKWGESGWPSWHDYAPIAEAAKENGLPMVAGNLPRDVLRPMINEGISALPTELAQKLSLPTLPDDIAARFDQEIADGHCNMLPKSQLPAFSLVQFARDASLARAMIDANKTISPDGAFLIAGAMHVRDDIAVPYHLRRYAPNLPGERDYALRMGSENVADFMWFTNDLPRADPCEDILIGQ